MALTLKQALKGVLDAERQLQTPAGISNPTVMSEGMMRLSQYTASVEEILAGYERDYELEYHRTLRQQLDAGEKTTAAERITDIEMAELKSQIRYLTRLVASAWKQVGVCQSRINHLTKESSTTNF